LDLPRQDIASRLSVKPETLSRLLKRLVTEGVVRVDGRRVDVLSVEQLRRFE
jgi:CRP-like cAMP-binding protein